MDKYEFNIKVEQIKKLVNKGDFETSMKIADTIDWRRVRNANLLSMIGEVYEKNEEYQEAKEILLLAFERAPIGKRLLSKLVELALKEGSIQEAEDYYREFCDMAPEDSRQHLLRYMILKAKKAPAEQLVHSLEQYTHSELDEKWLYELAELYHQAGQEADCVKICDKIMLMFGLGKYVDKAMELKLQYAPLTSYQMDLVENRDKYEEKLRAVASEYGNGAEEEVEEDYEEEPEPQTIDEELVVSFHEAEAEEQLARELSKISVEEAIEDDPSQHTKILGNIKDIASVSTAEPVIEEFEDEEDISEEEPEEEVAEEIEEPVIEEMEEEPGQMLTHFVIESRTPEQGLELGVETLKKLRMETDHNNPVMKITGSKLSKKGILNVADRLAGKDLIIEEAGDLDEDAVEDLKNLMAEDDTGMVVVLIDNPRQIENMHHDNPDFMQMFELIGVAKAPEPDVAEALEKQVAAQVKIAKEQLASVEEAPQAIPVTSDPQVAAARPAQAPAVPDREDEEEMDLDEFAEYACKYASEIDCSITGKSMLALYERIEIMEEDGIPLTKSNAEELIEEAADKAEKPSIGKLITGVFSSKYDKEGLLILREEHFIG